MQDVKYFVLNIQTRSPELLLDQNDVEADSKDEDGQILLSKAVEDRYEAIVKLLLDYNNIEVDSKDSLGMTLLSK